jgi:hypothetical protein
MPQFNIHLTPEFEKNLRLYMKQKGITQKSEALRQALQEALELIKNKKQTTDFSNWLGLALKAPQNPSPRFTHEDQLWDEK